MKWQRLLNKWRRLLNKMRRYRPIRAIVIGILITLALTVASVIALGSAGGWSTALDKIGFVAAVIALGGVLTTQMVNTALAGEQARADTLQKYLEQMQKLLTESKDGDTHYIGVARAQTLAVLKGLRKDPDRKRVVMLFLAESGLLNKDEGVFNLRKADLSDAYLGELDKGFLEKKDLSETSLEGANFSGTNLSGTKLRRAWLNKAILEGADLSGANLEGAKLSGADLSGANLKRAKLSRADLSGVDLSSTKGLSKEQIEKAITDKKTQLPLLPQAPRSVEQGSRSTKEEDRRAT